MNSEIKTPQLISEKDAAKALSVSYGWLKLLRRNNEISFVRIGRRGVRYSVKNLQEFVEKRQQSVK